MSHTLNQRMKNDIVDLAHQVAYSGNFTWPEVIMAFAECAGRVAGENAQNGPQVKELITVAQRFMVQAAHTAYEVKSGNTSSLVEG